MKQAEVARGDLVVESNRRASSSCRSPGSRSASRSPRRAVASKWRLGTETMRVSSVRRFAWAGFRRCAGLKGRFQAAHGGGFPFAEPGIRIECVQKNGGAPQGSALRRLSEPAFQAVSTQCKARLNQAEVGPGSDPEGHTGSDPGVGSETDSRIRLFSPGQTS